MPPLGPMWLGKDFTLCLHHGMHMHNVMYAVLTFTSVCVSALVMCCIQMADTIIRQATPVSNVKSLVFTARAMLALQALY